MHAFYWRYKLGIAFGILCLSFGLTTAYNQVQAQIEVEVDREFILSKQGVMSVAENESLTNKFSDRYLPGGSSRSYFFVISAQESSERTAVANIIYNSLTVVLNGEQIDFQRVKEGENYGITYSLRRRLNPNEKQTVRISYIHPELGEKVGGLVDAYIPAFAENFQFQLESTTYRYRTRLKIPKSSGEENIVSVEPASKFSEGDFDVYVFNQDSLIGKFVWVQRGNQQVYKFQLRQQVLATEAKQSGGINQYRMVLPRDIDEVRVAQTVYFTRITPEPLVVAKDSEANIIGVFRAPADRDFEIVLEGYAVVKNKGQGKISGAGRINEIDRVKFKKYLQPAEFWEVNAKEVEGKVETEVGDQEDVLTILNQLYGSVVEEIDYSQVKRFGLNERQGALKTLQGGAAVCMEYSDLYLTLLRNKGIPARAAFGYGYDSRLGADAQEAHQWVQAYLPEQDNWVSIDVTWGEAGPQLIGGDLNHFYTHVAAVDPNTPSVLSRLTIGAGASDLVGPEFEIEVLAELPINPESARTNQKLLQQYPGELSSERGYYLAVITSKYKASLTNLFSQPSQIDLQGWLLLGLSSLGLLIILALGLKVVWPIMAKLLKKLAVSL